MSNIDTIKKIKRKILRLQLVLKISFFLQKHKSDKSITYQIDKVNKILSAQYLFNIKTFVETGTYFGTTTKSVQKYFDKIYSIELNTLLADEAKNYFKNNKNVEILNGDSGKMLGGVLTKDPTKKIFWLDAHYSGGLTALSNEFGHTPISNELSKIFNNWIKGSVILIDDARLFNGKNNYPNYEDLRQFIFKQNEKLNIFIDKDIIHIF